MPVIEQRPRLRVDIRHLVAFVHDQNSALARMALALSRLETKAHEDMAEEIQVLRWEMRRITQIAANQLEYASLEAGTRENYDWQEVDLVPWVQQVCDQFLPTSRWRQIHLACVCTCGEARFRCDVVKLEQCLENLISNAIQFTPKQGMITVTMSIVEREIRLSVADTGAGMEEEMVVRVKKSLGKRRRMAELPIYGEAYGLSLVKTYAQGMGGRMELESEPGEGTEVSLWFPIESLRH